MAVPKDTSPDAWARQIAGIRAMTPQERLRLAAGMSDDLRTLARDGVRSRHPDWSEAEVATAVAELLLGTPLALRVRTGRSAIPR
jgi:hypothetical protein